MAAPVGVRGLPFTPQMFGKVPLFGLFAGLSSVDEEVNAALHASLDASDVDLLWLYAAWDAPKMGAFPVSDDHEWDVIQEWRDLHDPEFDKSVCRLEPAAAARSPSLILKRQMQALLQIQKQKRQCPPPPLPPPQAAKKPPQAAKKRPSHWRRKVGPGGWVD
jgi:hypothetical protein